MKMVSAARTVVLFGIILQVTGFAKLLVIADFFGAGPLLDAYYLALVIPTFLTGVSSGILQTGFVPAYVASRARGADDAARTIANVTLTWTLLGLTAAAALLCLLRGTALPLLAHGIAVPTQGALLPAYTLLMWMAPLNGLADGAAMLLNAEGRFAAAASAPLLNVVVGILVLFALRDLGIYALAWSLLAGLVAQALMVLAAIRLAGLSLRPRLTLQAAPGWLLAGIALPVLISNVLGNLVPALIQMVAARAGTGSLSAMGYASRLHNSLVQAVVMSVSVILLPHFARLMAQGRAAELRLSLERVFAATLLFAAASAVLVAAGGPVLIKLLLQRGTFTADDARLVARVWLALTAGLLGTTWGIFLARLFQAQQRPWVIATLACVSVVVNAVLAMAFVSPWGVVGVAAASSLAYTLIMCLFHRRASRMLGGLVSSATGLFVARALLANAAAYATALWCRDMLQEVGPVVVIAVQFGVVAATNVLLARTAPLRLTLRAMFGS